MGAHVLCPMSVSLCRYIEDTNYPNVTKFDQMIDNPDRNKKNKIEHPRAKAKGGSRRNGNRFLKHLRNGAYNFFKI